MTPLPEGVWRGEPLAGHTSVKVGGPADLFAAPATTEHLAGLLLWARAYGVPLRFIGGGTNLLVADAGVEGLVVKASTTRVEVEERPEGPVLVADAGVTFANVARRMAKLGYGGLEWAANVPGTVGGAAVNNAGAFGGDTRSDLVAVTLLQGDGTLRRMRVEEMGYAYRTSVLKRRELGDVAVLQVELRMRHSTPEEAQALVKHYQGQRTATQPRQLSMGSVFANPEGTYSGKLVEEAGLKGHRVGGAQVSPQHANFIVNAGGATAADVYTLMRTVQQRVFERTHIWLKPEVELMGRWTAEDRDALARPISVA